MEIRYPALFEPQPKGEILVRFVDLPGAITEGVDMEEASLNAVDALTGMLDLMLEKNRDIPSPSRDVPGARYVAPDAKTQAALLIRGTEDRALAVLAL